ncbi:MAG: hypothetical protein M3Z24_02025, partial [Chloroflexota bacterium]|nr:hypothetical protein [Chloroflexota bacterium]
MPKKKHPQIQVSQEAQIQAQHILEPYHEIARTIRESNERKAAESALDDINHLSENAQIALLKALSKEQDTDAADVLIALNELSPNKATRKEARRSLLRLEAMRIYPKWHPPVEQPLAVMSLPSVPPRFWKGFFTDSMDTGEMQLLLFWEQGEGYKEVRMLSYLLEFWHDGVKDFFTRIESKRSAENIIAEMQTSMSNIGVSECTLAKARHLIQDALDVNKKYGTRPHLDYRRSASLVQQLIFDADIEDIDEEE